MSFAFNGAAQSFLRRLSGNVANTNAFTKCYWIKRTASGTNVQYLSTFRSATTGHDLVVNDTGAYAPRLQINFGTTFAGPLSLLDLNSWEFIAQIGSGANLTVYLWDPVTESFESDVAGQTAFVPTNDEVGAVGTNAFVGLIAHIRDWNVALTLTELEAEMLSSTAVKTANLVSAKSGTGANITAALTGESGTAYTNGGAVTLSGDQPSLSSFTGPVISGEAVMPSQSVLAAGSRFNRVLWSGDLSNAVWAKQNNLIAGIPAAAPSEFGTAQRVLIRNNAGGVYQLMSNLPAGRHVAAMAARRVDADYVVFRHMAQGFGSGAQGFFNLATGQWATFSGFGGVSDPLPGVRDLGNGWYLIWLSATITVGNRIIEFFPTIGIEQIPAVDKSLDVCGFQYEEAISAVRATFHKPTTSAVAARTLASVVASLAATSIGTQQITVATVQLLDNAGAPWDQYKPVNFSSSDPSKATVVDVATLETDLSGRIITGVTAVANGTTNIAAEAGGITSAGIMLTVSATAIARYIEILVEEGWQATSGWAVGVYEKHSTGRFPRSWLFEALNQSFDPILSSLRSRMIVPVPTGISVTAGQVVEVVLENDNLQGRAVDGPGIFAATVI